MVYMHCHCGPKLLYTSELARALQTGRSPAGDLERRLAWVRSQVVPTEWASVALSLTFSVPWWITVLTPA